ncbi:hypothetical protein JCM10212_005771 [Sporobolomyces blumeae]
MDRRPPSPTRSVKSLTPSDLIRSYTTSSELSASRQLAAIAKAREDRRKQRTWDVGSRRRDDDGNGNDDDDDDDDDDEKDRDRGHRVEVEIHDMGQGPLQGNESADRASNGDDDLIVSLIPKLRVQPSSDPSFSPSIPSSESLHSGEGNDEAIIGGPAKPTPADDVEEDQPIPSPSPPSSEPAAALKSRRSSFEVAEIPPFRPRSTGTTSPPPSQPDAIATSPPRSSPSKVVLSGGLMERLKAQRHKATPEDPHPDPSTAPSSSTTDDSTRQASSEPSVASPPPALPPKDVGTDHTGSSTVGRRSTADGENERDDAVSELSRAFSDEGFGRVKARSKIYGRNGEEIDYDFTQLSDVLEASERSSLSTWRSSVPVFPPSSQRPTIPSVRERPLSSSAASTSTSSIDSTPLASAAFLDDRGSSSHSQSSRATPNGSRDAHTVDNRIDATSRLLGRTSSRPGSIFDASSSRRPASIATSATQRSLPGDPIASRNPANSSPTRKTSPEIARRAASFVVESPPPSPTKSSQARRFPSVDALSADADATAATPSPIAAVGEGEEDPIEAIERRRLARRARLDSIKALYAPKPTASNDLAREDEVTSMAGTPATFSDRWSSIERREAAQAVQDALRSPTILSSDDRLVASPLPPLPGSPARSGYLPNLCEGYLSVPPVDSIGLHDSYSRPSEWTSRYSVLNSSTLSFRPTDQNRLTKPIVVLILSECDRVEDDPPKPFPSTFRPFSVVLKDGERVWFACEKASERVRWLLALQDAINAARPQDRGPVASTSKVIIEPELYPTPAPVPAYSPSPYGLYSFDDKKRSSTKSSSLRSIGSTSPSKASSVPFDLSRKELPPSPLFATAAPVPAATIFPDPSTPKLGHARSRSEYTLYRTPDDEPPFRPQPTRPISLHDTELVELAAPRRSPLKASRATSMSNLGSPREDKEPYTPGFDPNWRPADSSGVSAFRRRFEDMLGGERTPASSPIVGPSGRRRLLEPDQQTFTTRRGMETASEVSSWAGNLREYEDQARMFRPPPPSSVASPTTVRREREATSRKLEGLPPLDGGPNRASLPTSRSGFRLDFRPTNKAEPARSGPFTDDLFLRDRARAANDPFAKSAAVRPQYGAAGSERANAFPRRGAESLARSRPETSSSRSDMSSVEELLWRIKDGFEEQQATFNLEHERQEQVAQVISSLAKWVAKDRQLRETQYQDLASAVNGVVDRVANLPQDLLAALQPAVPVSDNMVRATTDVDRGGDDSASAATLLDEGDVEADDDAPAANIAGSEGKKSTGKGFGINPMSSFARADRSAEPKAGDKPKGPRMPGIRIWGAPEPVADRGARWGVRPTNDEAQQLDAPDADAEASANGPVVEALRRDPNLSKTLEALAAAEGGEIDPALLSHAVFEILQTLREISQKQVDQARRDVDAPRGPQALTEAELAELEAKKAEIARIEAATAMNAERTARINELVAHLAQKTDKTDALLAEIAQNVRDGRTTTMDPALSDEVKKLLSGVQNGVVAHVADFRGKLTAEVQRMFKEVGKLRDEKKTLQTEIAELMAFQAKHGGAIWPKLPAAPAPKEEAGAAPPGPGFFGPRAMN